MDTKNRVAIYIRVSTQMQVDKDSLPMQRQDLSAYAQYILNTTDYKIFEDAGYSGKNTARPAFQEMLKGIRNGEFTHLLVWKIDRISRNLLDFATLYSELKQLGVIFVSKNEQFDTSTAMGEAMLKIILVFAELERNMTAERVTATMISRASNGQWNGGRIPFGYHYDPTTRTFSIDEQEAVLVRAMHDGYEREKSLVTLTYILNDSGYRTRQGSHWTPTSISVILKSMFYCGDYVYNYRKEGSRQKVKDSSEWVTITDHHPAIVSREQKARIMAQLHENLRFLQERGISAHRTKFIHVFGKLIFCGKCGHRMYSVTAGKRDNWDHSNYLCSTRRKSKTMCNQKSTSDAIVGEFIFNLLLNMLNAQKHFTKDTTNDELQRMILAGNTFSSIASIDPDDLDYIRNLLESDSLTGVIYGRTAETKQSKDSYAKLSQKRIKLNRALDRLRDLYLYSDEGISEKDYILQREKLENQLENIDQQIIALETSRKAEEDDEFLQRASEFIIAKNLSDRNYIYYKRLAQSVDRNILADFVSKVIERIVVTDDQFTSVSFKNNIVLHFDYKKEP